MMCIHCDKIVRGGGINRIKGHLAGEKGRLSVVKCNTEIERLSATE